MRIVVGVRLDGHLISNHTTPTSKECALLCLDVPACVSLNYIKSARVCELNDAVSTHYMVDYHENVGGDYIHFTSQRP